MPGDAIWDRLRTMPSRPRQRRTLLAASLGVAAVSYVACSNSSGHSSGNLMPPPKDASADAPKDAMDDVRGFDAIVANLIAPPIGGTGGVAGTGGNKSQGGATSSGAGGR